MNNEQKSDKIYGVFYGGGDCFYWDRDNCSGRKK